MQYNKDKLKELLTTVQKYHFCKDKPKDVKILKEDDDWFISDIQCFVLSLVKYCPYCGEKLEWKVMAEITKVETLKSTWKELEVAVKIRLDTLDLIKISNNQTVRLYFSLDPIGGLFVSIEKEWKVMAILRFKIEFKFVTDTESPYEIKIDRKNPSKDQVNEIKDWIVSSIDEYLDKIESEKWWFMLK